jgi:Family of unknown function (DUF5681)
MRSVSGVGVWSCSTFSGPIFGTILARSHAANSERNSVKPKAAKRGNPDKLKPYQFKPGESGNPSGRPRKMPMTEALIKRLGCRVPAKYSKALGLPENCTWADAIAWMQLFDLVKKPNADNHEKIAVCVDGPLVQEISGPQGAPIPMALDLGVSAGTNVHEQLRTVTSRLRDRLAKLSSQPAPER